MFTWKVMTLPIDAGTCRNISITVTLEPDRVQLCRCGLALHSEHSVSRLHYVLLWNRHVLASSGPSRGKSRSCFPLRPYLHCTQAYCLCRVPLRAHLHHAQAYCLCHVPLWPHLHRAQAYCPCHVPLRAHLHHAQAYCLCNGTVHRPTDTDV